MVDSVALARAFRSTILCSTFVILSDDVGKFNVFN